jgi:hypothetical protein
MRNGNSYPSCFDPYLRYAISTGFRDFEFFDQDSMLFFLVEFKQIAAAADDFEKAMKGNSEFAAAFGPAEDHTRYVTMRARTSAVLQPDALDIWDQHVSRVELSLPVKPTPRPDQFIGQPIDRYAQGQDPPGSLLIGVLDDGCPFAAAQFRRISARAPISTRVLGIWDQNQGKQPVNVTDRAGNQCVFGQTLLDFNYGLEFRRDFAVPGGPPREMGLDEWMGLHVTPAGSVNEDGCYADAGFTSLMFRKSHGAHVMDVFAGSIPTSSRIGPSGGDRRDPPSWTAGKPGTDPACGADLVFVQFPDSGIRDASGVWLKAYVVDGIRYILSFADPVKTKNVIINLSYGPTTGPHDGTAVLEAALTALVTHFNGNNIPKLEIALAAGNSYLTEGHVEFCREEKEPDYVEWTWRIPADNTVLCFAEVWMDNAEADGVAVTLTSPSGVVTSPGPATLTLPGLPIPSGTTTQVIGPIPCGNNTMWLLQVGPTVAAPGVEAKEHGDYTIKVAGIAEKAKVDAYVARTDPNMNVFTGAKRSYFVDPKWERTRSAEANCTRTNGEFDETGSLIHRDGTLNGIATAADPSVHVAGGDILANGRKSPYSSAGPARHGPRIGPDFALLTDESYALEGIRAGATRSGGVFRLTGTSAAAPQLARQTVKLARGLPFPQPTDVPSANDIVEIEKRGGGNIEPP